MAQKDVIAELQAKLDELESVLEALRSEDVDAGFGKNHVLLLRLKEAEEQLNKHHDYLDKLVQQRTEELRESNIRLENELDKRRVTEASLRESQSNLRSLASEILLAEERERRRIAVELHDGTSQNLALTMMRLDMLLKKAPPEMIEPLQEIRSEIRQLITTTRSLTFEISPPSLYDLGLESAIRDLITQIKARHNIDISFADDKQPKPLDDDIRVLLYQITRELIINMVKHAQAQHATVTIRRLDGQIMISVEDDGVGFDPAILTGNKRVAGFGLFSIRERLRQIGGTLEARSQNQRGSFIWITAPLKKE